MAKTTKERRRTSMRGGVNVDGGKAVVGVMVPRISLCKYESMSIRYRRLRTE